MRIRHLSRHARVALAAGVLLCGACDLSVTNPGPIGDADLDSPTAMPALVNGMSADLSVAIGNLLLEHAVMTDELTHSGNYANPREYAQGIINADNVNTRWADMQRARWVAEHGIARMKKVLGDSAFEKTPLAVRAYLYAGFANRLLGENVCAGIIDGGPRQSDSVYFERANDQFTEALRLAQALKVDSLATTAYAGRASVRAWLGDWTGAVDDAARVPDKFLFNAIFSLNTSRENNNLAYETISRREVSVWGTQWAKMFNDKRIPWDTVKTSAGKVQNGQDGKTPFFRQKKYATLAGNVPLVKGTEMLLLRAEAALRDGDVPGALLLMDQERNYYGLSPLTVAERAAPWATLLRERGAVLWLEARRFWDLRRWYAEGLDEGRTDGKQHFLDQRAKCIPISGYELASNPNL